MDRHHVLFNKREWESRPQYKDLRENAGLIIPIDREVHNELHRNVQQVPVLGYYGILAVQREFYRGRTHLETVDNLLFSLEQASENKKLTELDRALANISLQAVDLQRPFIVEGQVKI